MTATAQRTLTLSCVILTMGNRPAEVSRAIDSVLAQDLSLIHISEPTRPY